MTTPDPLQTLRDEAMLLRAGVITPEDRDDFYDHPQAWRHEIASCRKLEDAMTLASVDPAVGWTMTVAEMAQATIKAIRAGRSDSGLGEGLAPRRPMSAAGRLVWDALNGKGAPR